MADVGGDGAGGDGAGDVNNGGDGAGGDGAGDFTSGFADQDLAARVQRQGYKGPEDVAKAWMNMRKLHDGSGSVIAIPGDGAEAPEWDSFFNTLGRPENAADYNLNLGEDTQIDEKMLEWFKGVAHETGMSNTAAAKFVAKWNDYSGGISSDNETANEAAMAEAIQSVKDKWGTDFDTRVAEGQRARSKMNLAPETVDALDKSMGTPAVMDLMATLGRVMGEATFINGQGQEGFDVETKEQATVEINRLRNDKAFMEAYLDGSHPNHKINFQKFQNLQVKAQG